MTSSLLSVTFDAADPQGLAAFWSEVLGRPVDEEGATAGFASIGLTGPGRKLPAWTFLKVPEPKQAKSRCHPDLVARDLTAEVVRVVDLGATKTGAYEEDGVRWVALRDPEGNEFCIIAGSEEH
jgi:catechol 2,3-dioxygenase-like lactoylglutathione lyase family enzyme